MAVDESVYVVYKKFTHQFKKPLKMQLLLRQYNIVSFLYIDA